MKKCDNS